MSVKLVTRRKLWHDGIHYPAGAIISCDEELDAVHLLESGGVELHDPADAPKLKVYALAALRKMLARTGTPAPGSPWQSWPR